MKSEDFIVEKDGKQFVDVVKILPDLEDKITVVNYLANNQIEVYLKPKIPGRGHESKKVILKRFIELDNLFFEGLGLWQGEGGKDKGLYFGNTCLEILLYFLKFVEQKLGTSRNEFKVTVNVQELIDSEEEVNKRWSAMLRIPFQNFTRICVDKRINEEYAQVYFNSIILSRLMNELHEKLKPIILDRKEFAASYMRGIIAGEGQIAFKSWGTIAFIAITCGSEKVVDWYKSCLRVLDIESSKYQPITMKFPIYGRKNLEKVKSWKLCDLHPDKREAFSSGITNYQRAVVKGEEMEKLILKQLILIPKTYDEIAKALNKGRSTIQSHYIPILKKKGLIKRVGKRRQAWLFQITEKGKNSLKGR
jgi:hypothetical protein